MIDEQEWERMRAQHKELVAFVEANRRSYFAQMDSWSAHLDDGLRDARIACRIIAGMVILYGVAICGVPAFWAWSEGVYWAAAMLAIMGALAVAGGLWMIREARR